MTDQINDNTAQRRFELEVEGQLAAAYYERDGNVITLTTPKFRRSSAAKASAPRWSRARSSRFAPRG